ncbi:TonB-dependent receptor [Ketobacter sp. MCCC 1A13808]|uniref:TonB-dependent receptor n=1 Tax=Ketobacter sp. MCCC 1A13808 TaxID=2602738 RepID=UPI000F1387A8|nr:TonB-dependent receptor [Ketobacter sp. MCCC 1A13808]MVF13834.1 TonB-dependent receptor [Ketobacter sp. MCCC 1A13808]RLP54886.1 MAG: TonB-dependent receptor [Ketobacter sp.]
MKKPPRIVLSNISLSIITVQLPLVGLLISSPLSHAESVGHNVIEEVTVTAQRHTERSVDVPISVTAIGSEDLNKGGMQQLGDIMEMTPGLRFDQTGGFSQPTIRGVGTAVVVAGSGSNVGIYTDGFYSPNQLMADSDLLNVDSVQVLKGPQGTLFGRNSTGGAILVTTREPESDPQASLDVSYESFNTQRYALYASGGPSDNLAFDLATMLRKSDGYIENINTGSDKDGAYENWSVRTGVKMQFNDRVSALFRFIHEDVDDSNADAYNLYSKDGNVYSTAAFVAAAVPSEPPIASAPYKTSSDFKPRFLADSDVFQLTVKVDLDSALLTSYTQYRDESATHNYDFDASSSALAMSHYIFDTVDEVFTQELLLTSQSDSRLQWTTGLFYFSDETRFENNRGASALTGGAFVDNGGSGVENSSIALYGDLTYALLEDQLFLTLGARYSKDSVDNAYFLDDANNLAKVSVPSIDDSEVTPRAVLRYKASENSSAYVSYSEGFKSGILNVGRATLTGINVAPEKLKAYELGYKYSAGPLAIDLATFHYDYQDLQVAGYDGFTSVIENAADSSINGVEAQIRYLATESLEISMGLTYLDAEYDKFDRAQNWVQDTTATGLFQAQYVDASGNEMLRSPELTGNLNVKYDIPVAEGWLAIWGNLYYSSDFYFDTYETYEQNAYQLLNMRVSWTDASDTYTLSLYGDNLTDEEYYTQVLPQFFGVLTTWGAPRTFGAGVELRF